MKTTALFFALFFALTASARAQGESSCLSSDEAKKVIESMKPFAQNSLNKNLRKELVALREAREKLDAKIAADTTKNQNLVPESNKLGETNLKRVCQILKETGWISRDLVGDDGFDAFLFLITNHKNIPAQQELLPVLVEASKKGYIGNPLLASFVDSIRVGYRMPQIFGTQAAIRNNVVYLYPLLNEEKTDEWRRMYNLPPLAAQIRAFEMRYALPVLKSRRYPNAPNLQRKTNEKTSDTKILGLSDDENEPVKIDTKLVNLNVRVLTQDMKVPANLSLTKDDFTILEDGAEQEIAFFSNVEQPFDLVLLLDFSISTEGKQDQIKKAAQRFVEVARPADRIAVVAFTSNPTIISELTGDKAALKQKIGEIQMRGGSAVWDSLKFVYDNILKEKNPARRGAIVFMTDGEDSAMKTTFAETIETVRRQEATIFPVYFGAQRGFSEYSDRTIRLHQQMLSMLAEESGGQFYTANSAKDLSGIYEQVVNELGQVYSLGYEPKNETRDGGWRELSVKIKSRPELLVRTRRGYYAN